MKNEIVKVPNLRGDNMAYLITDIKDWGNSFDISFRTWSMDNECGGFETTYRISGTNISLAKSFIGDISEVKDACEILGAKLIKKSINNKVAEKWSFRNMEKVLRKAKIGELIG